MPFLVDTSVWSLFLRRDVPAKELEVQVLKDALEGSDVIVTTGLIIQELLQGFSGPSARKKILEHFAALPMLQPDRQDHIAAAELRNTCRRAGVQAGTIDALIAQLCVNNGLVLLTTDGDFKHIAKYCDLRIWSQKAKPS